MHRAVLSACRNAVEISTLRTALLVALGPLPALAAPAQTAVQARLGSVSTSSVEVVLEGQDWARVAADASAQLRWRWHFEPSTGRPATPWNSGPAQPDLRLGRPDGGALLELVLEADAGEGPFRRVFPLATDPTGPAPRPPLRAVSLGRARAPGDSILVSGRVVFGDRLFDAQGYTGARQWLAARHLEMEWTGAISGELVATTATDAQGNFEFALANPTQPGQLILRTRGTDPVAGPYAVVDGQGEAHEVVLGQVDAQPGEVLELGTIEVPDAGSSSLAGAVHLVDLLGDALELLGSPEGPSGWSGAGTGIEVRWDPAVANSSTFFDGSVVIVASPASGSSDAWSDGAVLAVYGHALLAPLGWPSPTAWDWLDIDRGPRTSFARATGWAFAGAVQERRARERLDAAGMPLLGSSALLVDLPSPPPVGFAVSLEAGLDLENGRMLPGPVAVYPRGQRGGPVLAALVWEALDGQDTADPDPGQDDDPIAGDTPRWFAAMDAALGVTSTPVYEDWHDRWSANASADEANALGDLAVVQAACALEIDAFEPDDGSPAAAPVQVWIQPPLTTIGVRINEIFLGDRDGVELVNRGTTAVDVGGWTIDARRNGFAVTPSRTVTLPAPTLILPGHPLLVIEGTAVSARSVLDAPAPDWDVPWDRDEDGAVILRDAGAVAVDFARWDGDGGADRSLEPIPPGTNFIGRLIAPVDPRQSLGRDAVSTDTNAASNFTIGAATPGWPNVAGARVHTLRPRGEVDLLRLAQTGRLAVHARRDRDDGVPRWTLAEGSADAVATLSNGTGAQGRGALATLWPVGTDTLTVLRLDTSAAAPTSTGLGVFAWRPASDFGVWPVRDLRADPLGLGTTADSVRVTWSVRGRTDSLRVRVDGVIARSMAGTDSSVVLQLAQGTHVIRVEAFLADRVGAPREVGVYIGTIPCAFATGFEPSDPQVASIGGGFLVSAGPSFEGAYALRDASVGGVYPPNAQAITSTILPVDLTESAQLRFAHAVHLVPDGDRAHLELSIDEGLTWIELASWDGSAHPVGPEDPANWDDGVLAAEDWVQESFELGAWAHERVRLRWRRTSNASGTSIGWSIDALVLDLGGTAGEYWIGVDGSDVTGCGLQERPWASFDPALAVVRPGDRIVLGPGRHQRLAASANAPVGVVAPLPAGVQLRGAGPQSTVIVAPAEGWGVWARGVHPDSSIARVRGLRIEGGAVGLRLQDVRAELDSVEVVDADTAAVLLRAPTTARASIFAHAAIGVHTQGAWLDLQHSTIADVGTGVWLAAEGDSLRAHASLLGRAQSSLVFTDAPRAAVSIECSGLFGTLNLFEGPITASVLANRNFDPQHCDPQARVYTLAASSPYLAHPWCGLVGARGLGCGAPGTTSAPAIAGALRWFAPTPNPFNPQVLLAWEQPHPGQARVEIFDLRGRRVRVLFDEFVLAGRREVSWRGDDDRGLGVASGVYLVRLRSGGTDVVQRVALIR